MSGAATIGAFGGTGRWRGIALDVGAAWIGAERGRFFPWLAVGMIAGAVQYFALLQEPRPWVGPAVLAGALVACVAVWRLAVPRALALLAAAAALGFASAQFATGRALPTEVLPMRAVVLNAAVRGVDVLPDGRRLVLEDVRLGPGAPPLSRHVRVRMKRGDATEVAAGDRIEMRALMRPPAPPAYPGAWDLQRDAYFAGLGGGGRRCRPWW